MFDYDELTETYRYFHKGLIVSQISKLAAENFAGARDAWGKLCLKTDWEDEITKRCMGISQKPLNPDEWCQEMIKKRVREGRW